MVEKMSRFCRLSGSGNSILRSNLNERKKFKQCFGSGSVLNNFEEISFWCTVPAGSEEGGVQGVVPVGGHDHLRQQNKALFGGGGGEAGLSIRIHFSRIRIQLFLVLPVRIRIQLLVLMQIRIQHDKIVNTNTKYFIPVTSFL